MAFFKIEKTGCSERKGLCQVRFDLFLEEGEPGYSDFYVQVSEKDKDGKDTGKTVWINTPFCCHFCQFEPTVKDEEILFVGELALAMQLENFCVHKDLSRPINERVWFSNDPVKHQECRARINKILSTDFTAVPVKSKDPYRVRG